MALGIFDSGVGGLSVLREVRRALPGTRLVYVADQRHVPYGPRPLEQVRAFSFGIATFLVERGAEAIVVACNTASAAALWPLRARFPATPFVGMEPAVKPAAGITRSGVVGVLATPATFEGELYASVVGRFAQGITVLQDTCPGLVAEIEAGRAGGLAARQILARALGPMLERGADAVVLGCTHYPFALPLIRELAGPGVQAIDPAPAVARQVARVAQDVGGFETGAPEAGGPEAGGTTYVTTGHPEDFARALRRLLDEDAPVGRASWSEDGTLRVD